MNSSHRAFYQGFKVTLPFLSANIPFGVLFATLAQASGISWWLTILLSVAVFGGSSQLVFIDLVQSLGSPLQAVLGSNIVNARHLIYSAGVSQRYSSFSLRWKLLLSYLLTDQLYAVSESERSKIDALPAQAVPWFFFGSGFCTWFFWVLATIIGIQFGQLIPQSWNLSFSIPLMFMPLVFSTCKDKPTVLACMATVFLVFTFYSLPYGLGVLMAILLGSFLGYLGRNLFGGGARES